MAIQQKIITILKNITTIKEKIAYNKEQIYDGKKI